MRLDAALVKLGLYGSREQAQRALLAGEVVVGGRRDAKPGTAVSVRGSEGGYELWRGQRRMEVVVCERRRYVSRGGIKLAGALEAFGIDPRGKIALDIGASTGGFTDCLLQRGAAHVIAVDCGKGQLDETLRNDPRVTVRERCNARYLTREDLGVEPDMVVVDVSFISLTLLVPVIASLIAPGGWLVALIKPQFEVGRAQVGRGGVVKDAVARRAAVEKVRACVEAHGGTIVGICESPLRGPAGNIEYFLAARMGAVRDDQDSPRGIEEQG
ncbi:MAG: TlyA family RNA methyltransferase [bacterium]|nr:TlyA family RNA methyltransferase [bacterium]